MGVLNVVLLTVTVREAMKAVAGVAAIVAALLVLRKGIDLLGRFFKK